MCFIFLKLLILISGRHRSIQVKGGARQQVPKGRSSQAEVRRERRWRRKRLFIGQRRAGSFSAEKTEKDSARRSWGRRRRRCRRRPGWGSGSGHGRSRLRSGARVRRFGRSTGFGRWRRTRFGRRRNWFGWWINKVFLDNKKYLNFAPAILLVR